MELRYILILNKIITIVGEWKKNMDNKKRNYNNSNSNNNKKPNSRPKRKHVSSSNNGTRRNSEHKPRRRRVSVDRDVEVVIVSNTLNSFYYENPRMAQVVDLQHINDEEYVTVGDLRTILNTSRSVLEGFSILITEVLSDKYTLEDVITFLGLDEKYEEYYSLTGKKQGSPAEVKDIKEFLMNAPINAFEKTMENIGDKLRSKVIETAITLFKLKEFGDYNKMRIIEEYVNDEIFDDAKETEIEEDVYI